jgi:DNA-binding transcriptional LysR family regulator
MSERTRSSELDPIRLLLRVTRIIRLPFRYAAISVDVELRHLRYFVAVAEEASFTAAARRVHVAQQVLSAQVRQLEGVLGVELLERSARGVRLTPAGIVFLDGARETLRALERASASSRNVGNAVAGVLQVGLNVAAGGEEPTRLLAEFDRQCPEVKVQLRTYELTHPAAGLLDHGTDVAFVRPPVASPAVTTKVIGSEPRVFVMASGHPWAGRERIDLADVVGQAWIAAELSIDGCEPRAWRDAWLINPRPSGEQPIIAAVAHSIDEWREYAAAGRGISLCPASAETHYARPDLAFVPSGGAPPTELCVAWRTGDANPLVQRFVDVVMEAAQVHA